MKVVIQRVKSSSVFVDRQVVGCIGKGFNILLGIFSEDTLEDIEYLVKKIINLRIFQDENNKMNLSIKDVRGEILLISQFTLCADTKKGNRPSFINSAKPDMANTYYEIFAKKLQEAGVLNVQKGIFAADMMVDIQNDGPVTIVLDGKNR